MEAFDTAQAAYDAALPDYYDNPGYDATPGFCALCEEDWYITEPPVETPFGRMHADCWASHDEACGEA